MTDVFEGVPTTYEDLYRTILFLLSLYLVGDVLCRQILRIVPSLVGHILVGMLLGPEVWNFVRPSPPETWVILGNLGLTLLVAQAGLEMDMDVLRLVGLRGIIIAIVGSILPISIGIGLAVALGGTDLDIKGAIAAGCSFGPTSAGIAMSVLKQNGVLHRPVGQLIVAAAIVDDMIALVVLSQLRALTGEQITVSGIVVPIVSAISWLLLGGAAALFIIPRVVNKIILVWFDAVDSVTKFWRGTKHDNRSEEKGSSATHRAAEETNQCTGTSAVPNQQCHNNRTRCAFILFFGLFVAMLPATYYSEASYLLGAFLTGLSFCRNENKDDGTSNGGVSALFISQFKRIVQWLMRIFFAAAIGFQVPIDELTSGGTVVLKGLVFTVALFGKLAVGPLLTPNFYATDTAERNNNRGNESLGGDCDAVEVFAMAADHQLPLHSRDNEHNTSFHRKHLRDCAIVGFSMAGEAEFAFVIALFGVTEGLVPSELYASVVFAILVSTIISPLLLRMTLTIYPYRLEEKRGEMEMVENKYDDGSSPTMVLAAGAEKKAGEFVPQRPMTLKVPGGSLFWHIQTKSHVIWGGLPQLLHYLHEFGLEVIDHRSWHQHCVEEQNDINGDAMKQGHSTGRKRVVWMWNDIYVKDRNFFSENVASSSSPSSLEVGMHDKASKAENIFECLTSSCLKKRREEIQMFLLHALKQSDSRVIVKHWIPSCIRNRAGVEIGKTRCRDTTNPDMNPVHTQLLAEKGFYIEPETVLQEASQELDRRQTERIAQSAKETNFTGAKGHGREVNDYDDLDEHDLLNDMPDAGDMKSAEVVVDGEVFDVVLDQDAMGQLHKRRGRQRVIIQHCS